MKKLPLCLFALLLLAIGCSSIDCPVENVVATVYKLKKSNGTADTLKDSMTIISHRINGKDTTVLKYGVNTTLFQLPVGYTNPVDTLFFVVKDGEFLYRDTVYVKKENQPHFESVDCKISYFHTITDISLITHHAIDSIVIKKTEVNYDLSTEHFHIYFKTADKRK